jgi:uncharacterized protein
MQLTEHRNENQLFVRRADADSVAVIDRTFRTSVALNSSRVIEDLPARRSGEIDRTTIARILELQPDVVLLGTGAQAVFPPQAVLAEFLRRGVGVETMDNAAAARTFNVLASEGRSAVVVFLLPG